MSKPDNIADDNNNNNPGKDNNLDKSNYSPNKSDNEYGKITSSGQDTYIIITKC
jgi:hypothetical protein